MKKWCGTGRLRRVRDGSEIHEAVITLLTIARNGAQTVCYPINRSARCHQPSDRGGDARAAPMCLVEAARIARSDICHGAGACGDAGR